MPRSIPDETTPLQPHILIFYHHISEIAKNHALPKLELVHLGVCADCVFLKMTVFLLFYFWVHLFIYLFSLGDGEWWGLGV